MGSEQRNIMLAICDWLLQTACPPALITKGRECSHHEIRKYTTLLVSTITKEFLTEHNICENKKKKDTYF